MVRADDHNDSHVVSGELDLPLRAGSMAGSEHWNTKLSIQIKTLNKCVELNGSFEYGLFRTKHMRRNMTKPTKWNVCPAKTQISLGIHLVRPESSLCAKWVAKDPRL